MSNPAGNALCCGDAENACSQHASPMLAASRGGLLHRGRAKASCHMGPSGGLTGFIGQKWEWGTQGTQVSFHLLNIFLTCILWAWLFSAWLFLFPLEDFDCFFLPWGLRFFKVYRNSNRISLMLVLMYPSWSLGIVLVLWRLNFKLKLRFSLWEIEVVVNAG